jgi:hypothetical protein
MSPSDASTANLPKNMNRKYNTEIYLVYTIVLVSCKTSLKERFRMLELTVSMQAGERLSLEQIGRFWRPAVRWDLKAGIARRCTAV